MKAVVVTPGAKGSLRLEEIPEPVAGERQALVRTLQVGLCGTDAEIIAGLYGQAPAGSPYLVLGHENFGIVERVGKGVETLRPGDFVVSTVRRPCPERCHPCQLGRQDFCLTGHFTERGINGLHGFLSEHYVEEERYLIRVDASVASYGALAEPTSVVEKAIDQAIEAQRRLPWEPHAALVTGAGPIGLLAALACRVRGLETWVYSKGPATGVRAAALAEVGARYLDSDGVAPADLDRTIGVIDLIVEATGYAPLLFDLIQEGGRNAVLCLTGISGGHRETQVDANQINLSLVLMNKMVLGSVNAGPADWARAVKRLADFHAAWGELAATLITRRVTMEELVHGLDKRPEDIKVVVEVSKP